MDKKSNQGMGKVLKMSKEEADNWALTPEGKKQRDARLTEMRLTPPEKEPKEE